MRYSTISLRDSSVFDGVLDAKGDVEGDGEKAGCTRGVYFSANLDDLELLYIRDCRGRASKDSAYRVLY